MNRCDTLRETGDLKAFADDELPLARRVVVRRHLAGCASCRREVETMKQLTAALQNDEPETALEPGLRAKILANVTSMEPGSEPSPTRETAWYRRPRLVWGAAAGALAAWFVGYPLVNGVVSPRPAAETASAGSSDAVKSRRELPQVAVSKPAARVMAPPNAPAAVAEMPSSGFDAAKAGAPPALVSASGGYPAAAAANFRAEKTIERNVRRQAQIAVVVSDIEAKSETVERMTHESGGFVAQSSLQTSDDNELRAATLALRVPVARFDDVLARVAKLGTVRTKEVAGEDITEQVSDADQALRVLNDELRAVVARQAKAVNPAETRRLRVEAAQARGRLDVLKKVAALAAITVTLHEKPRTEVRGGGFLKEMGDIGRTAINAFLSAARAPLVALIWVTAYAPLWVPLVLAYRWAARRERLRRPAAS